MTRQRRGTRARILLAPLLLMPIGYGLTGDPLDGSLRDSLRPPGAAFLLGTDHLGRDVLARIAHGFVLDVGLSLAILASSFAIGLSIGMLAAAIGGPLDRALTFAMDVLTALPQIVIALVLSVYLGGGAPSLILALSLAGWVKYARIARATTYSLREREFVTAARAAGGPRLYLLRRHILPHLLPVFAGLLALQFGHNILNIAALGFLGIGVAPPTPEWGAMIAEARPYFSRAPWLAIAPGMSLFLLTIVALSIARSANRDLRFENRPARWSGLR